MLIEAGDGQRPNRLNNIPLIGCEMRWKQVEEFRERVLPQEIVHLAKADFAGASILHLGSHQFHQFAD